jgi:membrane-associated phospholipid phosphatase
MIKKGSKPKWLVEIIFEIVFSLPKNMKKQHSNQGLTEDFLFLNVLFNSQQHSDLGMPSGHPALMCFFSITVVYFLVKGQKYRFLLFALSIIASLLVGYSRIMKRCHTVRQVTAGFVIGLIYAIIFISVMLAGLPSQWHYYSIE